MPVYNTQAEFNMGDLVGKVRIYRWELRYLMILIFPGRSFIFYIKADILSHYNSLSWKTIYTN